MNTTSLGKLLNQREELTSPQLLNKLDRLNLSDKKMVHDFCLDLLNFWGYDTQGAPRELNASTALSAFKNIHPVLDEKEVGKLMALLALAKDHLCLPEEVSAALTTFSDSINGQKPLLYAYIEEKNLPLSSIEAEARQIIKTQEALSEEIAMKSVGLALHDVEANMKENIRSRIHGYRELLYTKEQAKEAAQNWPRGDIYTTKTNEIYGDIISHLDLMSAQILAQSYPSDDFNMQVSNMINDYFKTHGYEQLATIRSALTDFKDHLIKIHKKNEENPRVSKINEMLETTTNTILPASQRIETVRKTLEDNNVLLHSRSDRSTAIRLLTQLKKAVATFNPVKVFTFWKKPLKSTELLTKVEQEVHPNKSDPGKRK